MHLKNIGTLLIAFFLSFQTAYCQDLIYPANGSAIKKNKITFRWDNKAITNPFRVYKLTITGRANNQNPATAANEHILTFEVKNKEFCKIDLSKFTNAGITAFLWQIKTYEGKKPVSESEVWSFSFNKPNFELNSLFDYYKPAKPGKILPFSLDCQNGDIENGDFTGWEKYHGSRNPTDYPTAPIPKLTIMSASDGYDPILMQAGVLLPVVNQGNYSMRIGDKYARAESDAAKYTFVVTQSNKNFSFRYAVVFEDPEHNPSEQQPFFDYRLIIGSIISPSMTTIATNHIISDGNSPYFKKGNVRGYSRIVYKEWTHVCIDLSNYIGQTLSIFFSTGDCSQGAHFGYAYIDALCENNDPVASFTIPNEICADKDLIADASSSTNETAHFWSIEESDQYWSRTGTEVNRWFVAQQAGITNLTQFYSSFGRSFKCNTYYRIGLAVANDCVGWNATTRLVFIRCPEVNAGADKCVGCNVIGSPGVEIGQAAMRNISYKWLPPIGLSNPNISNPGYYGNSSLSLPLTYKVTATDAYGCTASDEVTLYCARPILSLTQTPYCCGVTLSVNSRNYEPLQWSTGEENVNTIDVKTPGTYTVTSSNACGTSSQSLNIASINSIMGYPNTIAYPSKFHPPSGDNLYHDKFYIFDVMTNNAIKGTPNSYNANEFKLEIYNRWGSNFKTIQIKNCNGFNNWDIYWDGTDQNGNIVPQGTYTWKLYFKNCQYTDWAVPNERVLVNKECIKWAYFLGIRLWCKQYDVTSPDTKDVPISAGSVTVVGQ